MGCHGKRMGRTKGIGMTKHTTSDQLMAQSNGDTTSDELRAKVGSIKVARNTRSETFYTLADHSEFENIMTLIKQHELEAKIKILEELTRNAKRYNQHDPVVDLDIWAVPLAIIEEKLKAEREGI